MNRTLMINRWENKRQSWPNDKTLTKSRQPTLMINVTCVCIVFSVCQWSVFSFSEQWKHTISSLSTPFCQRAHPSNRRATTTFTAALKTMCCSAPSQVGFSISDALIFSLVRCFVGFSKFAGTCKQKKNTEKLQAMQHLHTDTKRLRHKKGSSVWKLDPVIQINCAEL